jgi:hypothetical protein
LPRRCAGCKKVAGHYSDHPEEQDRELCDLGLTRADIVRTAYEEAERSVEIYAPRCPAHGAALATAA